MSHSKASKMQKNSKKSIKKTKEKQSLFQKTNTLTP